MALFDPSLSPPSNPKKDAFEDAELTYMAIEIINDAGWLKTKSSSADTNDQFITELARDISREISYRSSIGFSPAMKPLGSYSPKSLSTNMSLPSSPSCSSSPSCGPQWNAGCLSSRQSTPNQKSCTIPVFSLDLDDCEPFSPFGNILTKSAPVPQKKIKHTVVQKRPSKEHSRGIQSKHTVVQKKPSKKHRIETIQSKLRLYKKRDKCGINIQIANVNGGDNDDHEYSFVSSPSSNDSMYDNEGAQTDYMNRTTLAQGVNTNTSPEGN